jgi:sortase (surface protein transpeptidase)
MVLATVIRAHTSTISQFGLQEREDASMHSSSAAQRLHRLRIITSNLLKQLNWHQRLLQFCSTHIGVTIILIVGLYIGVQVLFVHTFGVDATASIARIQAQRQINHLPDVQTDSQPLIAISSITRVIIPAADINAPVLTVGMLPATTTGEQEWNIARYAIGHHDKTGIPGQGQNIIFSSYASNYGRIFATLDKAIPGSTITVYEGDIAHNYTVVSQTLVKAPHPGTREQISNSALIAPTDGEQVTFITCWPPSGSNRYSNYLVVVAKP